jgi:hypothetical protein
MVKTRRAAALAGLMSSIALSVGAFSFPATSSQVPVRMAAQAADMPEAPAAGQAPAVRPAEPVAMPAGASAPAIQLAPSGVRTAADISLTFLRVAVTKHYGPLANASGYSVIVASGRDEAWAFGGTDPGGPSSPVAAQWNGSTLTPSALPRGLTGFITDASVLSSRDIWAASQYGRYVLRFDSHRWQVVGRWRYGQITGLSVISAQDVWAFGTTVTGSRVIGTWHFDGATWHPVAGPARSIYRASAISPRDIWAISAAGGADSILRYNGRTWRLVATGRALTGVQPRDILALSDQDVWVVGNQLGATGSARLVLAHWNGRGWSRLVSGLQAWPGRLAPGPHGDVLVTATPANGAATGLILHASDRGWGTTIVVQSGLGSGVTDVALAPGASAMWATGGVLTRLGGDAAIWAGPLPRADGDADDF